MADNVPITAGTGTSIATDDIGTIHYQRVKLVNGTLDATDAIPGDATNGLDVDVTRLPALVAGTANIGDVDVLTLPALIAGTALIGKVGIDQTTPGTTNAVVQKPTTSGGCSTYHAVSAATTNAANIKASAGQLYGVHVFNNADTPRYLKFHNTAGTPTAGASVFRTISVQAGTRSTDVFPAGIEFTTGIGITMVTGITDASAVAVGLSDLVVDVDYK